MKMIRKNGGFTLVELIVVIAILAILAGIAVPAYSGYINSANEAADQQKLEAVETAMSAALSLEGRNVDVAGSYFVATFASETVTIVAASGDNAPADVTDVWKNFCDFYNVAQTSPSVTVKMQYYTAATDIPALLGKVTVTAGS